MLVLSRKVKQRIVIGDNIELVVVAITGGRVKLGFIAPSDVTVHRKEILQRIASESAVDEPLNSCCDDGGDCEYHVGEPKKSRGRIA